MKIRDIFAAVEEFAPSYRVNTFWFWNDELHESELLAKLDEFNACGISELVIHPIHGMTVDYLSSEYLAKMRFTLENCRNKNIKVWLYDEFGWPSGNVGGKLLAEYPEYRGYHLYFEKQANGKVLAEPRLTERILDNTTGGPWCNAESGYLDTLSQAAVLKFIEMTHQTLYDAIGEDLWQDTVLGFFTDEVAAVLESVGRHGVWDCESLPWSPELPQVFMKMFGFSIVEHYSELAEVQTPSQIELRKKYWMAITKMHVENFYHAVRVWCNHHRVGFTGHMGDDFAIQQARFSTNIYQTLNEFTIPGWDYLGNKEPVNDTFAFQMTTINSAAKWQGKSRIFCEIFGVSPQNTTWIEMIKKVRLFGMYNINKLYLMGAHQSFKGLRKQLYWPPFFDGSTLFEKISEAKIQMEKALAFAAILNPVKRYAILYPQDQLEQVSIFDNAPWDELTNKKLQKSILLIQQNLENCDFVFREKLDATICQQYEQVFAFSDFFWYGETLEKIKELSLCQISTDELGNFLTDKRKLVDDYLIIDNSDKNIRLFANIFDDGLLLAIHNAKQELTELNLEVLKGFNLAKVDIDNNEFTSLGNKILLGRESTIYLALTREKLVANEQKTSQIELKSIRILPPYQNFAILKDVQFCHENKLLTGRSNHISIANHLLPVEFFGSESAIFSGVLEIVDEIEPVNIIFEREYIKFLSVDGVNISLTEAESVNVWDKSCAVVQVELSLGRHEVTGKMVYPKFESSMHNDGFFANSPLPTLDIAFEGNFAVDRLGNLKNFDFQNLSLPLNLAEVGFPVSRNPVTLLVEFELQEPTETLTIELFENCLGSVLIGDKEFFINDSLFVIPCEFKSGTNQIELKIYPSNGQLFGDNHAPWGIIKIR